MKKPNSNLPYAYIDVDLTLVDLDLNLLPEVAERLPALAAHYNLVCWSSGGAEYAKGICDRYMLSEHFIVFLDKPYIIIDDDPEHILSCRCAKIQHKAAWTEQNLWSNIFGKDVGPWLTNSQKKS